MLSTPSMTPVTIQLVGGPMDGAIYALEDEMPEFLLQILPGPEIPLRIVTYTHSGLLQDGEYDTEGRLIYYFDGYRGFL